MQALPCSWLCHFAQAFVWDLGKKKLSDSLCHLQGFLRRVS